MSLPCGARNHTYAEDMAIVRTKTQWVFMIGFLLFLFTLPGYLGNYWLSVINLIGIWIIAATGLNILTGYCGQLSIGHAGFVAVGAYASAILTTRFDMPFLVGLVGAGLIAGLVGIVFGLPSIRVKGFYLAITTIAAQFIIIWVIQEWRWTGGHLGMTVPLASIGGFVSLPQDPQDPRSVLPHHRDRSGRRVLRQEPGPDEGRAGLHRRP